MRIAGERKAPPEETRFRKGKSGNPKGRPRKQPVAPPSAFDVVIDRTLTIVEGGSPREVTVDEALQHKTYQDAIAGNRAARREVLKMIAKREKALSHKRIDVRPFETRTEWVDPRNADEALLVLGICRPNPRQIERDNQRQDLLLEPWAVEAALSRRAAKRMDKENVREAQRCTADPETLHWPEGVES